MREPQEDMSGITAVNELAVERKMLACLGFGVDHFYGVSDADFLKAVAEASAGELPLAPAAGASPEI
jgi:hypothetical protein